MNLTKIIAHLAVIAAAMGYLAEAGNIGQQAQQNISNADPYTKSSELPKLTQAPSVTPTDVALTPCPTKPSPTTTPIATPITTPAPTTPSTQPEEGSTPAPTKTDDTNQTKGEDTDKNSSGGIGGGTAKDGVSEGGGANGGAKGGIS
ncbi:hypothetical protein L914_00286, partial [Phytophthora nicotianae]